MARNEESDLQQWEQEMHGNGELQIVTRSLELAQELQTYIFLQPPEAQRDMAIQALQHLAEANEDVRGRKFYLHVMGAYAIFDKGEPEQHTILRYGEMYVGGSVGLYSMATYNDQYTLMMRLHEPQQLRVRDERDRIASRLPVPLSVPVANVESIFDRA